MSPITAMTRVDPDRDHTDTWAEDTVRAVHRHLISIAGPGGVAEASHRELAAALTAAGLPMSPATVRRAVHALLESGDLQLLRRGTGGRHRSRYRLT